MTDVDTTTHRQHRPLLGSLSQDRHIVGSATSPLCKNALSTNVSDAQADSEDVA